MTELTSSIIIPAYNCADTLRECVESILTQTALVLEIIVVDDKSSDKTINVAKGLNGVTVIEHTQRGGAGAARVSGVKAASGDLVVFIDSDCVAPPDWVESLENEFIRDPELGAVGGMYRHPHTDSLVAIFGKFEEEYIHHYFARTPNQSTLTGGNFAARRSIWNEARSGRELIHFQQIASAEDTVVANEIGAVSKTYFTTDIFVLHHPKNSFLGFLKRSVLRGRTRTTCIAYGLAVAKDNLFAAYGGPSLFCAAAALWLMAPVVVAFMVLPEMYGVWALTFLALLIAHYICTFRYFDFIKQSRARPYPVKLGFLQNIGLRLLLAVRAGCWVYGVLAGGGQFIKSRIKYYSKITLSILHFWRPGRISKLFYFVTSKCNARCEFCFNLDNVINWKQRAPQELQVWEIRKLAKSLCRLPYLTLSGGEPFARKDLPDVIRAFYDNAQTMWVTIPTNGALTKNIADDVLHILTTCPDIFLTIQFSIDSLHQAHDDSRKIKGGFDAMIKTAKRMSSLRRHYNNLRIQINTPYDSFNLDKLDDIQEYCNENIDFDQQLFYLFRKDGTLISDDNVHLVDGFLEFIKAHDENERRVRGRSLWGTAVRALQSMCYEDIKRIKKNHEYIRKCHATQAFVTLYDDGTVTPCEVLPQSKVGNVRDYDYDFYKMKKAVELDKFYKKEIVDTKCNCEWMCAPSINMLYHPRSWYNIFRGLIVSN